MSPQQLNDKAFQGISPQQLNENIPGHEPSTRYEYEMDLKLCISAYNSTTATTTTNMHNQL